MSIASLAAAVSRLKRSHRSVSLLFLPRRRRVPGCGTPAHLISLAFRTRKWVRDGQVVTLTIRPVVPFQ